MMRRCPALFAGLIVLLAFAAPAWAQGGRSEINGTVVDADKAVLPGVTITAINQDTGLERTVISSSEGQVHDSDPAPRHRTPSRRSSRDSRSRT